MFRRRRPLLGAAMIGGTAYAVGKSSVRNQQREEEEQARLEALEYQAAQPSPYQAAQPLPATGGPTDLAAKLTELKGLVDQGVLTDDEFTAAKQKLLAS